MNLAAQPVVSVIVPARNEAASLGACLVSLSAQAGIAYEVIVVDGHSTVAAANGQYLLVRRAAYEALGGHAAVRGSLLEDVELARLFKRSGRVLRFRYGGDAVRTRMHRSWPELRDSWTKNLALLFPDAVP